MEPLSWRLSGGMVALITKLCEELLMVALRRRLSFTRIGLTNDLPLPSSTSRWCTPLYHPLAGQTSIWDGTIHFAGTEIAYQHGGYLEGALITARRAAINL